MLTRRTIATAIAATPLWACQNIQTAITDATWSSGPQAPYDVQEIYPALHNGAIWIAGGFSRQAGGATERVIAFDPATNRWVDGPALPTPSHHVHLASLRGELYAIGGFIGGDTRDRWSCTPRMLKLSGDRWTDAPSLPRPIGEAVPIVHGDRIHLIGGRSPRAQANSAWTDHIDVDSHFVFSAETGVWSAAAALPLARNSSAGVSNGARLHVISGRTVNEGASAQHDIYDPRSDTWSSGPAFPDARGGLAAAHWRGRIVAGGGEILSPPSVADGVFALEQGAWQRVSTLPTPRHGHGFIVTGNALYVCGGSRRIATMETLATLDVLS